MTLQQFEREYAAGCGLTLEEFRSVFRVVPCRCGRNLCEGWAIVNKDATAKEIDERTKPRRHD